MIFQNFGIYPKELQIVALVNEIRNKNSKNPFEKYKKLQELLLEDQSLTCHVDLSLMISLLEEEGSETWNYIVSVVTLTLSNNIQQLSTIPPEQRQFLVQNAVQQLMQSRSDQEYLKSQTFRSNLFLIETFGFSFDLSDDQVVCIINSFRQLINTINRFPETLTESTFENIMTTLRLIRSLIQFMQDETLNQSWQQNKTKFLEDIYRTLVFSAKPSLPIYIINQALPIIFDIYLQIHQELESKSWIQKLLAILKFVCIDTNFNEEKEVQINETIVLICQHINYLSTIDKLPVSEKEQLLLQLLKLDHDQSSSQTADTSTCKNLHFLTMTSVISTICNLMSTAELALKVIQMSSLVQRVTLFILNESNKNLSQILIYESNIVSKVFNSTLSSFSFQHWQNIIMKLCEGVNGIKLQIISNWLCCLCQSGMLIDTSNYTIVVRNKSVQVMEHLLCMFQNNNEVFYLQAIIALMKSQEQSAKGLLNQRTLLQILEDGIVMEQTGFQRTVYVFVCSYLLQYENDKKEDGVLTSHLKQLKYESDVTPVLENKLQFHELFLDILKTEGQRLYPEIKQRM